jgi:heat shock protein 4
MIAAQKNPNFRVTEYNIEDSNFYPIRVGWLYGQTLDAAMKQEKMEVENSTITHLFPEKQRPVLFDNNCLVPSLKSFNLTKHEPVELTLFYDPVPAGC